MHLISFFEFLEDIEDLGFTDQVNRLNQQILRLSERQGVKCVESSRALSIIQKSQESSQASQRNALMSEDEKDDDLKSKYL